MKTETIEKIFKFLEEKEGMKPPMKWFDLLKKLKFIKFINELENHPDGVQYRYDGDLFLSDSNIKKLPNDLYVGGDLVLDFCYKFTELPTKLYVGGYFSARETNIEELPDNLYVGGNLYIENTPLANKFTDEQIYEMIKLRGGEIIGDIFSDY